MTINSAGASRSAWISVIRLCIFIVLMISSTASLLSQPPVAKHRMLVDISHGQKFYNDPAIMQGQDTAFVARIKYMTGELSKNAAALNTSVSFTKGALSKDALTKCDLLFIHMPSSKYSPAEVEAIQSYLKAGGSLFIVMEVDYWSTLEQANVNELLNPFGIQFKGDSPDQHTGGHTKEGEVAKKRYSIPYHGARTVEGGTPFSYSNASDDYSFGVYKKLPGGGRIIAMGDGMVSLYMTSWKDVNNYECSPFMHDSLAWLLKRK